MNCDSFETDSAKNCGNMFRFDSDNNSCDKSFFSCKGNNSKCNELHDDVAANISCTNDPYIWHKSRLAHASDNTLQHIKFLGVFIPSNNRKMDNLEACEVCDRAKQTRLPFPTHTSCTSATSELIHMDLWVSYSHPSLTHTSYMLTIIDDFSRAI